MKHTCYILSFLVLAVTLLSCLKDTDLNVEKQPPKIVIHGFAETEQPFQLFVGKSVNILDPVGYGQDSGISDANIQLYADGVLVDNFEYNGSYLPYTTRNGTIARPGVQYKVIASAPAVSAAEAETFLPNSFPQLPGSFFTRNIKKIDGEWMDEVRIRLTDPAGIPNFYILKILTPFYYNGNVSYYEGSNCIYTNDPDVDDSGLDPLVSACISNDIFLSDRNFDGKEKEVVLFVPVHQLAVVQDTTNGQIYRPVVEINNITEEYYKYRRSIEQYNRATDNPFAEPVSIFTNVKNGFGIFDIRHLQKDTLYIR